MSQARTAFTQIGQEVADAPESQMFGKPCFTVGGKAFVCFFQDEMVFKLPEGTRREAVELDGAQLADPSGKGRPMREWVQVPVAHEDAWPVFARLARGYVIGG